jgi:hypothetical protein
MQHIIEPNGNLTFIADAESMEDLQTIKDRVGGNDIAFLDQMLDSFGFIGNGRLWGISPEHVGALTEAPMLSDDVEHDDAGDVHVRGKVWWFPNYQVEDFAQTLLDRGRVTFHAAH